MDSPLPENDAGLPGAFLLADRHGRLRAMTLDEAVADSATLVPDSVGDRVHRDLVRHRAWLAYDLGARPWRVGRYDRGGADYPERLRELLAGTGPTEPR